MKEFDEKAATWDDDPLKIERVKVIGSQIKNDFKNLHFTNALEYGSGTGLLGFELIELFDHLQLMDNSGEMIRIANEKAQMLAKGKVTASQYNLLSDPLPVKRFDLIFTLLTMHHIENTDLILKKFSEILLPDGILIIIDLEKEDGSFHDSPFSGHLGFDKEDLETKLIKHSLLPIEYKCVYTIIKKERDAVDKAYPLFMSISSKKI